TYPRFQPAVFTAGFDVNAWLHRYAEDPNRPLLNRAAQGTYPPGSVFKIISLSGALESLKLDPNTEFFCPGVWNGLGPQFPKTCWLKSGHGRISLIDGLTQSCNIVFYEVGLALHRKDPALLPQWARAFGLGQLTDIFGLHEESAGVVPDDEWKRATFNEPLFDGDAVNSAIGQGFVLATPLQIVRMLAAVGNGGTLVRPRVIDKIVAVDGTETVIQPETAGNLPLTAESIALIKGSLNAITSGARGTARKAFEGATYTVAGKTGTAESGRKEPHAWFAGYAPADEPRVAISVILEEAGEGSKVAAPLFRQTLEAFFAWEARRA
ncbi:MAG: penicillin-binding protein 2, partial [Chloroflexi bacterium]